MPQKRGSRGASGRRSGGGAAKTVLAFVLGAGAAAGAGYLYLHHAAPATPVAPAGEPSTPMPERRARPPLSGAQHPSPPFGISEDVFEAGARVYASRCSSCHGTPRSDAAGQPTADQLWRKARPMIARHAPGELYSLIAKGAPARGMPAYASTLTDTQIWQIALLLKNADGDLPDPVVDILNHRSSSNAGSR